MKGAEQEEEIDSGDCLSIYTEGHICLARRLMLIFCVQLGSQGGGWEAARSGVDRQQPLDAGHDRPCGAHVWDASHRADPQAHLALHGVYYKPA